MFQDAINPTIKKKENFSVRSPSEDFMVALPYFKFNQISIMFQQDPNVSANWSGNIKRWKLIYIKFSSRIKFQLEKYFTAV